MNLAEARRLAKPTERDKAIIAEVKENGGTLTVEEFAWTRVWDRVGSAWSGYRARRIAMSEESKTGIPHVGTPDGSWYRLREEYRGGAS